MVMRRFLDTPLSGKLQQLGGKGLERNLGRRQNIYHVPRPTLLGMVWCQFDHTIKVAVVRVFVVRVNPGHRRVVFPTYGKP